MNNPFSTIFGLEPNNFIKWVDESNKIISEFSSDNPPNYVYFLTGIREFGKTVLLSFIYNELKEKRSGLNMNSNNHVEVFKVRERCNFDTNNFSVYRDRLIKKGVIKSSSYGFIEFTLPRLNEFLRLK